MVVMVDHASVSVGVAEDVAVAVVGLELEVAVVHSPLSSN